MFENGRVVKSPTKRKQIESQKPENGEQVLQNVEVPMPCMDCKVNDICKYAVPFRCSDFNPKVFTISVTCIAKSKVYARFTTSEKPENWEEQ